MVSATMRTSLQLIGFATLCWVQRIVHGFQDVIVGPVLTPKRASVATSSAAAHHNIIGTTSLLLLAAKKENGDDDDDSAFDAFPLKPSNLIISNGASQWNGDSLQQQVPPPPPPSSPPPPPPGVERPNKADIYSIDELQNILNLHSNLQESSVFDQDSSSSSAPNEAPFNATAKDTLGMSMIPGGLHEMVQMALEDIEKEEEDKTNEDEETPTVNADVDWSEIARRYPIKDETLRQRILNIKAIACDVDGTLLTSSQDVHPLTQAAVSLAAATANSPVRPLQYIFLATGKSRWGALHSVGATVQSCFTSTKMPGVYTQGLYCVDGDGQVVFEQHVEADAVEAFQSWCQTRNLSWFGYYGENLYTTSWSHDHHIKEVHDKWGEPVPIPLSSTTTDDMPPYFNKCLCMSDDGESIRQLRPDFEKLAEKYGCSSTQAVETMLELLPLGSNKALGVQQLCRNLGIDPATELMAVGDGENDLEMLQMAAVGVAMGNAPAFVKEAADLVVEETNNEGGAGVAVALFGLGYVLQ